MRPRRSRWINAARPEALHGVRGSAMRLVYRAAATAALLLTTTPAVADVAIPFTKTTLANGMTLIIHEDHAVPIAVVNVSYSVGSHYETPGRTGFARPSPRRRAPCCCASRTR